MAQNSVSISMTKLRNDAFLADAGYKNMGGNEKDGLLKKVELYQTIKQELNLKL